MLAPILKSSASADKLTCRTASSKSQHDCHTNVCVPRTALTPPGVAWKTLSQALTQAFEQSDEISPNHPAAACLRHLDVAALLRDLEDYQCWKPGEYTRATVLKGNGFEVMLLCWPPGSMSPVHAHSDADTKVKSNCFLTVLKGELHETTFEPHEVSGDTVTSEGQTRALAAGVSGYINDDIGVHKVGNASNTIPAVSLHVYAPGWSKVPVYTEAPTDAGGAAMDAEWGDF